MVGLAIDNLQHFTSFKRLKQLKEEQDKGIFILRTNSIADYCSEELLEVRKGFYSQAVDDDFLEEEDLCIDPNEFEEARSDGLFKNLLVDEESKEELMDEKEREEILRKNRTHENLNSLILKRIDKMMTQAKTRNPLSGKQHEKRVNDIRQGKFKI